MQPRASFAMVSNPRFVCRMMRFRQKPLLILIPVLFVFLFRKIPDCYRPLSLVKIYRTPLRFHGTMCQVSGNEESMIQPYGANSTIQQYVTHGESKGRLGNLMFQMASTFGIAAALGFKTYIDQTHPLLPYFEISPSTRMNLMNNVVLSEEECMSSVWRCRNDIYSHNVTISGWLQSWKYFHHIAPTIRKHFTLKPHYRGPAKVFMNKINSENRTIVGIHVRRGDFRSLYFSTCGYTMASSNYFQRAMQLYRNEFKNVLFIVISDDMAWCRENIAGDDVIYSHFEDPITDLALMSMCDHMIMSGGTFGFWGSWLAGGKVIYFKDWPRPGSWLDTYGMIKEDFWPPNWIGLNDSATMLSKSTFVSAITSLILFLLL